MKIPKYAGGGSSGQRVSQQVLTGFSGGLNLSRSPLDLDKTEVSDAYDVVFPETGGVAMRGSCAAVSNQAIGESLHLFERYGAATQVLFTLYTASTTMALRNTATPNTNITTWTWAAANATSNIRPCSVVMNNAFYLFRGHGLAPLKWDGSTATTMKSVVAGEVFAYTSDPTVGTGTKMPRARCAAIWQDSLWIGNVVDPATGTAQPNRVMWSWPDKAEEWPDFGYEDVDVGERSDEIVALVPDGDRLIVFKRNSIHAIVGNGPSNYYRIPISSTVGAAGFDAVCRTDKGVFFYDYPTGVYMLNGKQVVPISLPIKPALNDGSFIVPAQVHHVGVEWDGDDHLYVSASTPADGDSGSGAKVLESFVYNLRNKAWTKFSYGVKDLLPAVPEAGLDRPTALVSFAANELFFFGMGSGPQFGGTYYVCRINLSSNADDLAGLPLPIRSRFRTSVLTGGDPGRIKRWRKIGVIGSAGALLVLRPYTDYANTPNATQQVTIPGGSGSLWGTVDWGEFVWASSTARAGYAEGRVVGNGRVLDIQVDGSQSPVPWHVTSIAAKYVNRRRNDS